MSSSAAKTGAEATNGVKTDNVAWRKMLQWGRSHPTLNAAGRCFHLSCLVPSHLGTLTRFQLCSFETPQGHVHAIEVDHDIFAQGYEFEFSDSRFLPDHN